MASIRTKSLVFVTLIRIRTMYVQNFGCVQNINSPTWMDRIEFGGTQLSCLILPYHLSWPLHDKCWHPPMNPANDSGLVCNRQGANRHRPKQPIIRRTPSPPFKQINMTGEGEGERKEIPRTLPDTVIDSTEQPINAIRPEVFIRRYVVKVHKLHWKLQTF